MINSRLRHLTSLRRMMLFLSATALLALSLAAPALAQLKGDWVVFAQCQVKNPEVSFCIHATNTGGELQIGKVTIPINKAITFQGGSIEDPNTGQEKFVGAYNGETLSKTPLSVPGGLAAVVDPTSLPKGLHEVYEKLITEGLTGVTATIELVGNPGISLANLLQEQDVALELPIRVKLSNPFLGEECYIGSQANPVTLALTTGTTSPPKPNKPITGTAGTLSFEDSSEILVIAGYQLVDNAFSVPGAAGCGGIYSAFIDPAVNARMGLPSAAGHNTAVLSGTMQVAAASDVINQMK
jgi:hypothetical protein